MQDENHEQMNRQGPENLAKALHWQANSSILSVGSMVSKDTVARSVVR
jgi:hypothetical protein